MHQQEPPTIPCCCTSWWFLMQLHLIEADIQNNQGDTAYGGSPDIQTRKCCTKHTIRKATGCSLPPPPPLPCRLYPLLRSFNLPVAPPPSPPLPSPGSLAPNLSGPYSQPSSSNSLTLTATRKPQRSTVLLLHQDKAAQVPTQRKLPRQSLGRLRGWANHHMHFTPLLT